MDYETMYACADCTAHRVYKKLPPESRSLMEKQDLTQEFLEYLLLKKDNFDPQKGTEDAFMWFVVSIRGKQVLERLWKEANAEREYAGQMENLVKVPLENSVDFFDVVCIDNNDPLTCLVREIDNMEKLEKEKVQEAEVKRLCKVFRKEFNKDNPLGSLIEVLELALNKITDEHFESLPEAVQERFLQLGERVKKQGVVIQKSVPKSTGITFMVRKMLRRRPYKVKEIMAELDRRGVIYNEKSLKRIVYKVRKEEFDYLAPGTNPGFSKRGIRDFVEEQFGKKKGKVSAEEIAADIRNRGVQVDTKYVAAELRRLRKEEQEC